MSAKYGCCSARSAGSRRSGWYWRICWGPGPGRGANAGEGACERGRTARRQARMLAHGPSASRSLRRPAWAAGSQTAPPRTSASAESPGSRAGGAALIPRRRTHGRRQDVAGGLFARPTVPAAAASDAQTCRASGRSIIPGHVSSVGVPHTVLPRSRTLLCRTVPSLPPPTPPPPPQPGVPSFLRRSGYRNILLSWSWALLPGKSARPEAISADIVPRGVKADMGRCPNEFAGPTTPRTSRNAARVPTHRQRCSPQTTCRWTSSSAASPGAHPARGTRALRPG